jgi:RHS repeat-associated protein
LILISVVSVLPAGARVPTHAQAQAQVQASALEPGQTQTLLPDGRLLMAGGKNSSGGVETKAFLKGPGTEAITALSPGLNVARAGHTATVLPDGTVLIFGGVGADGQVVRTTELFDPATQKFSVLTDVLAVPRAFHTATLLTDGKLLLAGGVLAGGEIPDDVQLWDFRTRQAVSHHALLSVPREGHTAVLLADGNVRVSGGTDGFGRPVKTGEMDEIYDPLTRRFRFSNSADAAVSAENNAPGVQIAESIPEDGALVAMRFTRLLNVASVNGSSFVLLDANGKTVEAKVTAAESGRLAFVAPAAPLEPGSVYTLRVKGVADTKGAELAEASISFTTEGEPAAGDDGQGVGGGPATTKLRDLPPLQGAPGETALAGQVLKLNGWPLEHVTLEMDGKKVRTDHSGRFLLTDLKAGHHVLWIDGSTANHDGVVYGVYEVGATILSGKTNVLNYTIWMTRLDTANTVSIPSPTTQETVITNSHLPGLELHLPAGTVITDRWGKVVHQVNITPIPIEKPPFPLPAGVQVPIYFTVQPGGAYLKVLNPGNGPSGARLIYPNGFNFKPGMPFSFWNYDADARGWFIYGEGKVSADARNIIPDPGVVLYEFTGAMVGSPNGAKKAACLGDSCPAGSDPVSLATGQFIYNKIDLALSDTLPISFTRTYISDDSLSRAFGIGATHAYDMFMVGDTFPYTYQELILPDGGRIRFDRISAGSSFDSAVYIHSSSDSAFYGAVLSWNLDPSLPGAWKLVLKNGTIYSFPDAMNSTNPFCQAVIQIMDRYGNKIKLDRTPKTNSPSSCVLTKVTSPNGRTITLTNDNQGRITQAADNIGRVVNYSYDAAGRLSSVTDVGGGVTTYAYDDQNRMTTITDARGILYLTNQYDSAGRVVRQTEADNGTYLFNWTPTANTSQARIFDGGNGGGVGTANIVVASGCWGTNGYNRYSAGCNAGYMPLVQQVDVTDPRGYVERVVFGATGYMASDTHALGQPEQQTVTYAYYADNTLKSVTDALGRTTSFDYDSLGNTTRVTRLDGTSSAVTSTFAYGGIFGQLSSVTDPLSHTSSFSYDGLGNLVTVTDPLNHQSTFAYNTFGQLSSMTDALSNSVQLGYFNGDLVTAADPLGNVSQRFADGAGRVFSATDAQGNTAKSQYNSLNLLTQTTDAQGHNTSFAYDANGNLLSLADVLNHTTSYTYDNMDRTVTRTDSLNRQERFSYDLNGNLVSSTDRKGKVTSFTYDPLNRVKLLGYNTMVNGGNTTYESTVTCTYDAGNRLTQLVDSAGGTITRVYDNLDRLTSDTTPQGTISYSYDVAGRRTSMQVAGQPTVNYSYDNASRLTQIAQGTSSTSFSYDSANRRTSLTLPNGVVVSYSYDNGSRLTGITYQFGSNTLGNLSYVYDPLGRRIQVGGSFARTGLPGAVASSAYDAANELTNWNGLSISYDANGNMLSDGSNTFSWNARNQITTVNSVSLKYDAAGRRIQNAAGKSFLYTGANAVQELSGSTVTANLLGGGIDELFTRADSSGTFTPLTDALGSIVALVDANGNINTSYSYDPFGNTTASGATSSNLLQYTGRENEGNGLYYYRGRYYSPVLGRFISEDPLGFGGGDANLYGYVFNDPVNLVDPFGETGGVLVLGPPIGAGIGTDVIVGTGAGIATAGGIIIVVGEAAPGVGLAGTAGWAIGRGIGHIPTVGGGTVDQGWQDIFTDWLFPETAANWALARRPICLTRSNPFVGKPGSISVTKQPNGQPKQVRRYGRDGYPEKDVDYDHDHGQGQPHVHEWGRPSNGGPPTHVDRGIGRPPQPGDPTPP